MSHTNAVSVASFSHLPGHCIVTSVAPANLSAGNVVGNSSRPLPLLVTNVFTR